jgi:hypothetical protein
MLLDKNQRDNLNDLFFIIKLQDRNAHSSIDNSVKIEQILAYLEVLHSEIRKISRKRKLIFVDSAAGNCYLSYLVYYFYERIDNRNIEIHCVDTNGKLMDSNKTLASRLAFDNMFFHAIDINDFIIDKTVDVVYSLHACDTATDKTMYLGIKNSAKIIPNYAIGISNA